MKLTNFYNSPKIAFSWLAAFNIIALFIKIYISKSGYTYDFESYILVSDIFLRGENVYSETSRYNYGPIWFNVIGNLRGVWTNPAHFHLALVVFLSLVDVAISFLLAKIISLKAALIFSLNPISLIITAYYLQFDNLAILFGLLALSKNQADKNYLNLIKYIFFLFLSLSTKHLLIFLPLCLTFKSFLNERKFKLSSAVLLVPYLLFILSFLPFLKAENFRLILNNVFLYQSVHNQGLLKGMVENNGIILPGFVYSLILLSACLLTTILSYKKSNLDFLSLHMGSVFCFLPGMAPQYLVHWLLLWVAKPKNIYLIIAVIFSFALLISISPGLQVSWLDHRLFRLAIVQLLVLAAIFSIYLEKKVI